MRRRISLSQRPPPVSVTEVDHDHTGSIRPDVEVMTAADRGEASVSELGPLDLLVLGSGVAGLSAAARAAEGEPGVRIGVLSKGALSDSATQWAQGE